mgnify:CR=1 FL=1
MIMNKSLYIVAFSLAFATTGIAQNNEGQDKVIDLGTQTTTELRKTQAVSTIYSCLLYTSPSPRDS